MIVHIFQRSIREYYDIENLYGEKMIK
nr:RsfS/YbeB/iojap family protein [Bacteroidetes bacterium endosymbiont of Geopemphigus sp.]